jgi:hypothetical protein
MTFSSVSRSALEVEEVAATAAGVTGLCAGVGAVTRWRAAGAGAATAAGSDGEAGARAGELAAAGGSVARTACWVTGRSFGTGTTRFAGEEAASFAGWEPVCWAGDAFAFLVGEEFFCCLASDEATGSEFTAEKDRSRVRSADRSVGRAANCNGLARRKGLTAILGCESMG